MFNKIILLTMLVASIMGQGMGDGVSKSTWASSDPSKCAAFIKKYIPAKEAPDDCTDGKCECATQGRFQLENGSSFGGFGLHTINCTQHPYGEHSLMDVENMIHAEWGNFTEYHPFMDYNVQLHSPELDDYIKKFDSDKVAWTGLKWKSDDEKTYYSVIVNVCGYVVFEIIGHSLEESRFTETDMLRFSFKSRHNAPSRPINKRLTAIGISRATQRIKEIKAFYTKSIGIEMLTEKTYEDGSSNHIFMWDKPTKGIQISFWSGRKTPEGAKFTPKMFEDYMRSVHDKVMVSDVCGFDQWMDNHYAYDGKMSPGSPPTFLDVYTKHAKSLGLQYHWWSLPAPPSRFQMHPHHKKLQPGSGGGMTQVYIVDPTGFGVQFDGPSQNAPKNLPEYSAACKSDDGCAGQGLKTCKDTDVFFKFLQ